jgi:hypothetical protein
MPCLPFKKDGSVFHEKRNVNLEILSFFHLEGGPHLLQTLIKVV